ncbi:MAG: hypothetical protein HYR84_02725 [Planctomycetes bacterium]|nr:hypothetical protein [Planctomycetota bacterium]
MWNLFGKSALIALACLGMFFANQAQSDGHPAAKHAPPSAVSVASVAGDHDLQGGTYVGKLVNLTTYDGEIYVRSRVLAQDSMFLTIRFRNAPYSIPWTRIKSVEVVANQ